MSLPPPPPPPYLGYSIGYGDDKSYSPPPYTLTNMQSTPYGASAAHIPAPFPPDLKPGIFNVWGITGYTGSIDTSGSLNPSETACHLAKMQQAMLGHNQFDHTTFAQTSAPAPPSAPATKIEDVPKPPPPTEADLKKQAQSSSPYSGYCPAYPGYGFNFGLAPPPCPPDPPKDVKKEKDGSRCRHCKGESGHPVKKIKKLDGELLCWACVWRAYAGMAEEVWRESGEVKEVDEEGHGEE